MSTKIEWCDETINPFIGCSKCSTGCNSCYAERIAARMVHNPKIAHLYENTVEDGRWTGHINYNLKSLEKIASFRKPRKIFIGSMSDIFHENVSQYMFEKVFRYISSFQQHTFILLTKRPDIMKKRMEDLFMLYKAKKLDFNSPFYHWPLKNLWLGVTVCNQLEAEEKIPKLLTIPAAIRFVSIEPMVEAIDLIQLDCFSCYPPFGRFTFDCLRGISKGKFIINYNENKLDWVIVGGETGPNARPMNPEWVYSIRDQCVSTNTPFFFKRWGKYQYCEKCYGTGIFEVGSKEIKKARCPACFGEKYIEVRNQLAIEGIIYHQFPKEEQCVILSSEE